jgi:23S rRNA (uracil1939-C5)-methyltransferase
MPELILEVERIIWRGRGLAREPSGRVVLVQPGVYPGERIRARVVREKADYVEAEWIEVLEPAAYRRPHPCPYSSECGGCRFGSIPNREQLSLKEQLLKSELRRGLGRKLAEHLPEEIQAFSSPKGWRYRWRGQIIVADGRAHMMRLQSREPVAIDDCLLLASPLAAGLPEVCRRAEPGRRTIAASPADTTVLLSGEEGRIRLDLPAFDMELAVAAGDFFQANWGLNRELIEFVVQRVAQKERVADLFAGAGNFALPAATAARSVLALEGSASAAASAAQSAGMHGLANLQVRECDLRKTDPAELIKPFEPEALIVDPPRTGAGKSLESLIRLPSLSRVVWISCDVVNSCRDLRRWLEAGWRIREAALFDMFPQTWHLEAVFVLE